MKKIISFFRKRCDSCDCDVKAVMIKSAFNGDFVCEDVVNCIESEEATDEQIPAIMFGLTRATASFLKALEQSGTAGRKLFGAMLNVWLEDVDDYEYFKTWSKELKEHRLGIK